MSLTINSVKATEEQDVLLINYTLGTMTSDFWYRPDDPYGLSPAIREWLQANEGNYEIEPYVPPPPLSPEELREQMPPVTARQLRLTLVRNGYSLSSIDDAIQALPEGQTKDEAAIEWEYATQFERLAPTLLTIAAALNISAEDIDAMWQQALAA